jgi:hypothetical protein
MLFLKGQVPTKRDWQFIVRAAWTRFITSATQFIARAVETRFITSTTQFIACLAMPERITLPDEELEYPCRWGSDLDLQQCLDQKGMHAALE